MARVLVVDDDAELRRALSRVLGKDGHEVIEAGDGRTALRMFAGDPVDLVLSDVYMPDMDGIDFLMRARSAFPEARIVIMSGGGNLPAAAVLDAASSLGADMTLSKPFTPDEVRAAVERVLAIEK